MLQKRKIVICLLGLLAGPVFSLPLQSLSIPPGFSISVYASPVPGARQMTLGSNDIVYVGSISAHTVYAIVPDKQNPAKKIVKIIADNLHKPNGVAFYKGDLYVADINKILRYKDIEHHLDHPPAPDIVTESLPDDTHHGWRYIHFGPDGKLYIGIGAPCNACISEDQRFASIMRMDADGSNQEVYARGVRNTMGFDWDPITHDLWFTDNGRDWMGDDSPPDELNRAVKKDMHFGFPYCHGKNIPDPKFGSMFPCSAFNPPMADLQAHSASLGMIFYTGKMFPKEYSHQIFIAEHGSWNRSSKVGYQVVSVQFKQNKPHINIFISGWLKNDKVWGRPVDFLQLSDGSLLISDDYADVIYRVSYH